MVEYSEEEGREFITRRLRVFAVAPRQAAQLCRSLLKDEEVSGLVPWMDGKSAKELDQETLRIELLCAAGGLNVWAIQLLEDQVIVGAIIETSSLAGSNVEAILGRDCWGHGFADEALAPVLHWVAS
ncbi:GNAT family N-acetyltransferase [Paraburkholderia sp. BL10I2N1]|uniref:GNAT family N-acetyltransferase n=1 Tax=Paraburkholderia sp. BL10I2N1 TaxID=1938796 RepID=UPI00105F59FF|nr:GNAT family N-acetyltransferase [Paraburkholderia sp. BL10I2N1]TDN59163.1 acetyltransferase (GNAT) family protein [Paraburkholderia sp. BL10I2N1]